MGRTFEIAVKTLDQDLRQDLETGRPNCQLKFFGASKFLRGTTIYSDFNHEHV